MRFFLSVITLVALFAFAFAWDKEDYEIFDLVSAVENSEGKGTTFYSWLGVSETAKSPEISKAYRKKSLELHPDKNQGIKDANERYARLGVVAQILRSEGRERYDFWMKRGVPKWRGTGYYYSRFRPGLGTVLVFLTFLTALLQNVVHRITYKSELARVRKFILLARQAAWGSKLTGRTEAARKVKVNIRGNPDVEGEEQEYIPGRTVEMLVQGDEVYLLEDGERHIIDESVPLKPSFTRTWPIALVMWLVGLVRGKKAETSEVVEEEESEAVSDEGSDEPKAKVATGNAVAASKAGGRRRKGGKR
ncbi:hypothetical protein M408DRAFT_331342 [Serendipita vermifera MAFF 305830]|uniref:J domain-containing protein n=1 Tax=Serendipita vermifera MAFF 305830 TaxID=933852 RepID=A0A0C3AKZ3_SERVB|nr:hypothetical protein M408DRAFT_331342 [Serendipita vermifera MAFF 305830]